MYVLKLDLKIWESKQNPNLLAEDDIAFTFILKAFTSYVYTKVQTIHPHTTETYLPVKEQKKKLTSTAYKTLISFLR